MRRASSLIGSKKEYSFDMRGLAHLAFQGLVANSPYYSVRRWIPISNSTSIVLFFYVSFRRLGGTQTALSTSNPKLKRNTVNFILYYYLKWL